MRRFPRLPSRTREPLARSPLFGWLLLRTRLPPPPSALFSAPRAMPKQSIYDEVELEDLAYDAERDLFHYPCPCGDRFEITRKQLRDAEDIATCPSCSLVIRVVFDPVSRREMGHGLGGVVRL